MLEVMNHSIQCLQSKQQKEYDENLEKKIIEWQNIYTRIKLNPKHYIIREIFQDNIETSSVFLVDCAGYYENTNIKITPDSLHWNLLEMERYEDIDFTIEEVKKSIDNYCIECKEKYQCLFEKIIQYRVRKGWCM